jgi:hypothetical protein
MKKKPAPMPKTATVVKTPSLATKKLATKKAYSSFTDLVKSLNKRKV